MQFGYGVGGGTTAIESARRRWLTVLLAFLLGAAMVLAVATPVYGDDDDENHPSEITITDTGGCTVDVTVKNTTGESPGDEYELVSIDVHNATGSVASIDPRSAVIRPGLSQKFPVTGLPDTDFYKAVVVIDVYELERERGKIVRDEFEGRETHESAFVSVTCIEPPIADAGEDYSGFEGSAIDISGSGTTGDGPITYKWSVNSPLCTIADDEAVNTTITCADNGGYTLTLVASNEAGASAPDSATVDVDNVAPTVGVPTVEVPLPPAPAEVGEPVTVSASFSDPGSADTHTCSIDWGDGDVTAGVIANGDCTGSHPYDEPRPTIAIPVPYTVTVTVTDDDLDFDTASDTIEVFDVVCEQGAECEIPLEGNVSGNIACIIGACTTNVEEGGEEDEAQILVDGGQYIIVIKVKKGPAPGQASVQVDKELNGTFVTLPACGQNGPPNCTHINRLKGNVTEYTVFFTFGEDPRFRFR